MSLEIVLNNHKTSISFNNLYDDKARLKHINFLNLIFISVLEPELSPMRFL